MWEFIPKAERSDAQVLLTLPNGEFEYLDGFPYQEFRLTGSGEGEPFLTPAGPSHTRYRYLPWQAGTHSWQHRSLAGGILEQGAFDADPRARIGVTGPASAIEPLALPREGEEVPGLLAVETALDRLARTGAGARIDLDADRDALLLEGGEPDLARLWVLDTILRQAGARRVPVLLRLPSPSGPDPVLLRAALHGFVCRYAAMPALAAWEVAAPEPAAHAAIQFLRACDPRRPVQRSEGST